MSSYNEQPVLPYPHANGNVVYDSVRTNGNNGPHGAPYLQGVPNGGMSTSNGQPPMSGQPYSTSEGVKSDSEEPVASTRGKRKSTGQDRNQQKKKRNRAVLSCVPCKARKIKCDRKLPCESCVKRGMTDECCWDDVSKILEPQPFANAREVEDLRSRLESVEALLARIPPSLLEALPHVASGSNSRLSKADNPVEAELDDHEGQEAAVGALEELALGERVISKRNITAALAPNAEMKLGVCGIQLPRSFTTESAASRTQSTIFLSHAPRPDHNGATVFLQETSPAAMIRLVMKALPAKKLTDLLWHYYYNEYSWSGECESQIVNQREYDEFWTYFEGGGKIEMLDPAWLAFLFVRLAVATRSIPEDRLQPLLADISLIYALPDQFLLASKMCLDIAQWWRRPQFRVIQCLIVQADFIWYSLQVNEGLVWMTAAARLAELMGLHKLGPDPTQMPPWDDLAFPTGPSLYKRQLCCRAWHSILFLDKIYSLDFRFASVNLPEANTPLPLNCNDIDILTNDLQFQGKPMDVLTDTWVDLIRWEVVGIWAECAEKPNMSYDDLLGFDHRMSKFLESLPIELLHAWVGKPGCSRKTIFTRSVLFSAVHSQLIKMHMAYFYRSYKKPQFQRSHTVCIESANIVIQSALEYHAVSKEQRHWWTYVQSFCAVLVLVVDALRFSDSADSGHLVEARISAITSSMPLFLHAKEYARVAMARRIGHVGQLLIDAAATSARERLAAARKGIRTQESYADLFKRVTASIRLDASDTLSGSPGSTTTSYPLAAATRIEATLHPEPTLWADPNASTDLLRSMGLSLDGLLDTPPSTAYPSNGLPESSATPSWPAPSVFDELFSSNNFFTSGFGSI